MKIASYNVNGINGWLNVLLRWLEEAAPDVEFIPKSGHRTQDLWF